MWSLQYVDMNIGGEESPSTPNQSNADGDALTVTSGSSVTTPIDNIGLFAGLEGLLDESYAKNCDPFSTELDSLLGM